MAPDPSRIFAMNNRRLPPALVDFVFGPVVR